MSARHQQGPRSSRRVYIYTGADCRRTLVQLHAERLLERGANMIHFLGIGAQKAGTTWICQHLSQHPHTRFSAGKESISGIAAAAMRLSGGPVRLPMITRGESRARHASIRHWTRPQFEKLRFCLSSTKRLRSAFSAEQFVDHVRRHHQTSGSRSHDDLSHLGVDTKWVGEVLSTEPLNRFSPAPP
jgi:hypothetical protein